MTYEIDNSLLTDEDLEIENDQLNDEDLEVLEALEDFGYTN